MRPWNIEECKAYAQQLRDKTRASTAEHAAQAIEYLLGLAQPEQEPVAWRWTESNGKHWFDWTTDWTHHDRAKKMGVPVEYAYTTPPRREWVGLTEAEKVNVAIACGCADVAWMDFADAIEAKLREKNS